MKHKKHYIYLSITFFMLCCCVLPNGCISVGPDYRPPKLKDPNFTVAGLSVLDNATPDTQKLADWWNGFNDPMMVELITRALTGSPDIHVAAARVQAARANWESAAPIIFRK